MLLQNLMWVLAMNRKQNTMFDDPLLYITFSIYHNPGVYALLLGSGVSRAAQIPTGWEITLDLINKVAAIIGETTNNDSENWYSEKYKEEPDYSKLLEELAKPQTERRALLNAYFEPTEEEREKGIKVPTKAHTAIASLVKQGYVKVILTTNFDRLIEQALETEGIIPDIISNEDSLEGTIPFIHSKCIIIKLHGDYKDTRIKNTSSELEQYSRKMNKLLDRILDEFGLIISGWSGQWDTALRNAILRCQNRRFTTYWTTLSHIAEKSEDLIKQRKALVITIESADQFFSDLTEKIMSLAQAEHPHPASTTIAVENVKRFLSEDKYRIQLHDLINNEVEKVYSELSSDTFDTKVQNFNEESFQHRLKQYEAVLSTLIAMISTIVYYDNEQKYVDMLIHTIERLCKQPRNNGNAIFLDLQFYPALMIMYCAGIVALAKKHYNYLAANLLVPHYKDIHGKQKMLKKVNVWYIFTHDSHKHVPIPNAARRYTPANEHISNILRGLIGSYFPDEDKYTETFDIFEYLLGLVYIDTIYDEWGPVGCFKWRYSQGDEHIGPGAGFIAEGLIEDKDWGLLKVGFFSGSVVRLQNAIDKFNDFLRKVQYS
jgi:hypothetical protein